MRKKTPIIKGGKGFINSIIDLFRPYLNTVKSVINVDGPFIVDNVYKEYLRKQDNKITKGEHIKQIYEDKKENLKEKLNKITSEYDKLNNNILEKEAQQVQRQKVSNDFFIAIISFIANGVYTLFYEIVFKSISGGIKWFFNTIFGAISKFLDITTKHRGPLLVFIIFIVALILLFLIIFSIFGNKDADKGSFNYDTSSIQNDLIQNTKSSDMFSSNFNKLVDLIPDKYKIQLTSLKNSFNKMIGNDVIGISANNLIREDITTGRYDGIYHIKRNKDDDNTISILKPQDLEFKLEEINKRLYPNIDVYKLPDKLKNKYINQRYEIRIKSSIDPATGKYTYEGRDAESLDISSGKNDDYSNIPANENPFEYNENGLKIKKIPIKNISYNENDNLNPNILKEKILIYDTDIQKYKYQDGYINRKIKYQ
jgi:hypothetical protein